MDGLYGRFDDTDRDMLGLLANQAAVALDNAQWSQGLERKVAQRTEELSASKAVIEQRANELAIINSIQEGMAAALDFQAIVDLVGDKLRGVFNTPDLGIRWYDEKSNLVHYLYAYEHGTRLHIAPQPPTPGGMGETMRRTRRPFIVNTAADYQQVRGRTLPGTDVSKSLIGVPIISSDRVLGSIIIENFEREDAYGKSEVRLLTTIAASLGTALENARLFDETQHLLKETEQRNAELAIINSVQAALAAELSIQGIYDAVGDKIRDIFHNTDMTIRIYDATTNVVHYPYVYENGKRSVVEAHPLIEGFSAHVIRTREPLVLNEDVRGAMAQYGSYVFPGTEPEKSSIWVPLVTGGQARGLINLVNMEREHAFSDSDMRLLQTLANSMSVALENARLFDETQRLLKETEQRNAELAIINSVQAALAAELNIQGIYDAVGEKIREIFHDADLGIRIYDAKTGAIHYPYLCENGKRLYIESEFGPEQGFGAQVMRTREPLVINERMAEATAKYGSYTIPGTQTEKSLLMVPLVTGDQCRGVINLLDMEREHAFGDSDVRLLQTLANSMGVALENARLFDETQRLFKESEQRAAELAIINSIQQGIAAELDFQSIVDLVGDKLREVFNTPDLGISWYNESSGLLHYLYMYEHGQRLAIEPQPPNPGGSFETMVGTRAPYVLNTAADYEKRGEFTFPGTDRSKSLINVPIISSDRVLGAISIENYERENAYGESELRLLTTIAASLGAALENARLFDETQRLLKETEQRNAELAVINSIQQGVGAELNFQAIVDLVGDKLREVFHTGDMAITWRDEAAGVARFLYSYEHGVRLRNQTVPVDPERPVYKALLGRQPVVIKDRAAADALDIRTFEGTDRSKSSVFVPMFAGERMLGTIIVENYEREDAFDEADVRLLGTVAASMGVALENARLFDETQRLFKESEQRAAELAIINSVQEGLAASSTSRRSSTSSATRLPRSSARRPCRSAARQGERHARDAV